MLLVYTFFLFRFYYIGKDLFEILRTYPNNFLSSYCAPLVVAIFILFMLVYLKQVELVQCIVVGGEIG